MKAEIITDADDLAAIEPAWWALWRRQPNATPFTAPAWLIPWWLAFAPGVLMSVAVWNERGLVALAPLYLEHGPHGRRLLPLGISISDYSDILIDPAAGPEAGRTLTAALEAQSDKWDLWSAEESPPDAWVLDLLPYPGWSQATIAQSVCPVLPLPVESQGLASVVPSSMMRKWHMARNRTARRSHRFEIAEAGSVSTMLLDLFRLHEARWTSKGEGGVLRDPRVRLFHQLAAPMMMDAGLLRLRLLRIEDRVAGAYYGFEDRRNAYAYLGGFDPAFAFESPGTVLLGAAIEDAVAAGCSAFHFLRGQEPYKMAWGAGARWNTRRTFKGSVR